MKLWCLYLRGMWELNFKKLMKMQFAKCFLFRFYVNKSIVFFEILVYEFLLEITSYIISLSLLCFVKTMNFNSSWKYVELLCFFLSLVFFISFIVLCFCLLISNGSLNSFMLYIYFVLIYTVSPHFDTQTISAILILSVSFFWFTNY